VGQGRTLEVHVTEEGYVPGFFESATSYPFMKSELSILVPIPYS
jgi:hypothetical protein